MKRHLPTRTSVDHQMQNISHVLHDKGETWIRGYKPLSNIGTGILPSLKRYVEEHLSHKTSPLPLYPSPTDVPETRTLPPTGYWMFVCNPRFWDADKWLAQGIDELLYKISKHNRKEFQVGDLAVLRVATLKGKPARIVAIAEVASSPIECPDSDTTAYVDKSDANQVAWRVRLRILSDFAQDPLIIKNLPNTDDFKYFRQPLQTSSIPISRAAFSRVWVHSGLTGDVLDIERQTATRMGTRALEDQNRDQTPKQKTRISKYIERGPVGAEVKIARKHICQICEALGSSSPAFIKKDGSAYSEAHHVQPVSELSEGSLGCDNIMVLCPNHHRQAHYGCFEVLETEKLYWHILIDGKEVTIERYLG